MATASPMSGSVMVRSSQPAAERGIGAEQAEAAQCQRAVDKIKHGNLHLLVVAEMWGHTASRFDAGIAGRI
jgi:hypothetical protein